MASKLLASQQYYRTYHKSFRCLSRCVRRFSNESNSNGRTAKPEVSEVASEPPPQRWLNIRAGIFGPADNRLPLPGDVGLGKHLDLGSVAYPELRHRSKTPDILNNLTNHTNYERQIATVYQLKTDREIQVSTMSQEDAELDGTSNSNHVLECRAQECPELVKKDFLDLFPDMNLRNRDLTVVTLSQKTLNDMSGWTEDVEVEREELIEQFIMVAEEICSALKKEHYWADFIDPCSGRPYLGQFTSATFFETDERYRHLGFRIEDLGCCKVISHKLWGTHVFVGAIFTNAPLNSEILEAALGRHKKPDNSDS